MTLNPTTLKAHVIPHATNQATVFAFGTVLDETHPMMMCIVSHSHCDSFTTRAVSCIKFLRGHPSSDCSSRSALNSKVQVQTIFQSRLSMVL